MLVQNFMVLESNAVTQKVQSIAIMSHVVRENCSVQDFSTDFMGEKKSSSVELEESQGTVLANMFIENGRSLRECCGGNPQSHDHSLGYEAC